MVFLAENEDVVAQGLEANCGVSHVLRHLDAFANLVFALDEKIAGCFVSTDLLTFQYPVNPFFTAHGYVIDSKGYESFITIEGVERLNNITKREVVDFANTFKHADTLEIDYDYLYCWYD